MDGEWVTGEFNGTTDDYEYAERIIRFRNPRFAISISSPLYWDVVYGPELMGLERIYRWYVCLCIPDVQ